MPNDQTSGVSVTPTISPESVFPAIDTGKPDLLAPYKNSDGYLYLSITDDGINQSFTTAAWAFAVFEVGHPDLKNLEMDYDVNPAIEWSISMYQENKYKSVVFNVNNAKDPDGNYHDVKMTVILRETGDEPRAYVSRATLDGRDLLPTYPSDGIVVIPTRRTLPADRILDK